MIAPKNVKDARLVMKLVDVKGCADNDTVEKKLDCLFVVLDKNFATVDHAITAAKKELSQQINDLSGRVNMLPSEAALREESTSIQKLMLDFKMRLDITERNVARVQADMATMNRSITSLEDSLERGLASTRETLLDTMKEKNDELRKDMNARFDELEKRFATKDDLKAFATKDDLKAFATKDDLKAFATKDDVSEIKDILKGMQSTR